MKTHERAVKIDALRRGSWDHPRLRENWDRRVAAGKNISDPEKRRQIEQPYFDEARRIRAELIAELEAEADI